MENMIEITGVDLKQFVKDVYDLSKPQGLGFKHFTPKPLSDEEAESIVIRSSERFPVDVDYVRGRACKMTVFRDKENPERLYIHDKWYDHSESALQELLSRHGITVAK